MSSHFRFRSEVPPYHRGFIYRIDPTFPHPALRPDHWRAYLRDRGLGGRQQPL